MLTVYKMAQDLAVYAYKTDNQALADIVNDFIDADDLVMEHGSPRNKAMARKAYRRMKVAYNYHFARGDL